jgi:tetratricopeptide (TPR) repeat protein
MIEVIENHGVNFRLTAGIRQKLLAAGARMELINAVQRNYRFSKQVSTPGGQSPGSGQYDDVIAEAQNKFNIDENPAGAILTLERAIEENPRNFRAYQLLGFVYLYGLKDYKMAEKNMTKAIDLGGSGVFRVQHSHDLTFSFNCEGSLYISRNDVRYESDNVEHTFDVPKRDIRRATTLGGWGKFIRLKGGAFKITIRDRNDEDKDDKDKYNFSPISGKKNETKMIIRLIGK